MNKRELLALPVPPCAEPIPPKNDTGYTMKYAAAVQIAPGGDAPLNVALYTIDRQLLLRIFAAEKRRWIYKASTGKWSDADVSHAVTGEQYAWIEEYVYMPAADEADVKAFLNRYADDSDQYYGKHACTFGKLIRFLDSLKSEKQKLKNESHWDRHGEIYRKARETKPALPEDVEQFVLGAPLSRSKYVFYTTGKRKQKQGYCTHCKSEFTVEQTVKHKQEGVCPCCQSQISYRNANLSHKHFRDVDYFCIMQKLPRRRIYYIRTYQVKRDYSKNYRNVETEYALGFISYFNLETRECDSFATYWFHHGPGFGSAQWGDNGFYEHNWCIHRLDYVYPIKEDTFFSDEVYQLYEDYCGQTVKGRFYYMKDLLRDTFRVPCLTYLIKLGFEHLAREIVGGAKYGRVLSLHGKNINSVFRMARHDVNIVRDQKFSLEEIGRYKNMIQRGYKRNELLFFWIKKTAYDKDRFENILRYSTLGKMRNYYHKQELLGIDSISSFLVYWSDYLETAKKLEYDVTPDIILYPRNLRQKHDEVADIHRALLEERARQKNAEKTRELKKLAKKYNKRLAYKNGQFLIRAAESVEELVEEGRMLQHCVGGYAASIIEGTSVVMFVRDVNDPDTPLCTVEYHKNTKRVGQCSGVKNELHNENVISFIAEWKSKKKIA